MASAAPAVDAGIVQAAAVVGFNPESIISDALFYDGNAMSAAEIQAFLNAKIGTCQNGKCLNVLTTGISSRGAVVSQTTGNLICSAIQGGTMPVSELIYRVQVACGISAKVILTTLQKEQGLTTSSAPSDWNLKAAMGASCPDTAPCDPAFAGVGPQILKGTQQLKTYKAANFAKQPGVNFIGYNPNSACGGTTLNIRNYATAALYNYTPYQPNAAALAAGYGLGDGCSSYGNRNFYNYYTQWFGSTQGIVNPFGALDVVEARPGVFRVAGWAIDPDTSDPIQVHVWVDDKSATALTANGSRADVGAVYPRYGAAHGFDAEVPAVGPGTHQVCAYAINVMSGGNVQLGCRTLTAMSGAPIGYLDAVTAVAGGIRAVGWAIDPDTSSAAVVKFSVDGNAGSSLTADVVRSDIARNYPAYGGAHGFYGTREVPVGRHEVCAVAVNVGPGADTALGCASVTVTEAVDGKRDPLGSIDAVSVVGKTVTISGWAWDPDSSAPVTVRAVSGDQAATTTTGASRPDVGTVYPAAGTNRGYSISLRLAPGTREICLTAVNAGLGGDTALGCRTVTLLAPLDVDPWGSLDEVRTDASGITAIGWAFDPDTPAPISVKISVDGTGSVYLADKTRSDIGRIYPEYGDRHGFTQTISATPGAHQVCAAAINDYTGAAVPIGCKSVIVPAPKADSLPIGYLDAVSVAPGSLTAVGWTLDPDTAEPIVVHIYVDSATTKGRADQYRADIARNYPTFGGNHGYSMTIPTSPGAHRVCAYGIGDVVNRNTLLGCKDVVVPAVVNDAPPIGYLDSAAVSAGSVTASGWTLDPDTTAPIVVHIYVDSAVTKVTADQNRDDIARIYPAYGGAHGYSTTIATTSGAHRVCAYGIGNVVDRNSLLGCKDVIVP
ncbi:MAG: hypothetical protein ABS63_01335 [Microbacterium sp. SCN 70-27]|nr:MAG: hypothetical protein ABS63_01335 [Microbacterium sp. SCN 70-27]